MDCIDQGLLQAYLDQEVDEPEKKRIELHLKNCHHCKKMLAELQDNQNFTRKMITQYKEQTERFSEKNSQPDSNKYQQTNQPRRAWVRQIALAACITLFFMTSLIASPIRATISDFLSIFRVENVKKINLSLEELRKIQHQIRDQVGEIDLKDLGKIKIDGGQESWITKKEAANLTDLPILFLADPTLAEPRIKTSEPTTIEFILEIPKINQILKSFGGDKPLPKELDGKSFMVKTPRIVEMEYLVAGNSLKIMQTKPPEIIVPSEISVEEVYHPLIELPILPDNLQKQLSSIKDWRYTIYVPMINSESQEVNINGSKGYAGSVKKSTETLNVVLWYFSETFYYLEGNFELDHLIELAKNMR